MSWYNLGSNSSITEVAKRLQDVMQGPEKLTLTKAPEENILVLQKSVTRVSTGWIRIKPAFWADGEILLAGDLPERENGKEIRAFPVTRYASMIMKGLSDD